MEKKTDNISVDDPIVGYFHAVSPIKTSKRNTRYFNATVQTARQEYHQAVFFTPEKHNSIVTAEKNKTPIKLNNARKTIGFKDDYDIQCTRETSIDVTTVDFTYKQPQETQLNIDEITNMPKFQSILKLLATVCDIDAASSMVSVRDSTSEVKSCLLGDQTGTIKLSLWDAQMDRVQLGKTYMFTNLSTRSFNGKTTLTTTRSTTIIHSSTTITLPNTSNTNDFESQKNTLTETVEGSTITIKKLCPKCHSTQQSINIKENFHRCTTCKILRKNSSYITKYNGVLLFKIGQDELSLAIPNSVLTNFIRKEKDMTFLDAQDIEEYLLTCGPVSVNYTNDNHIMDIKKAICETELTSEETLEQELCSVTDAVSLPSTSTRTKPGEKRPAEPET